jgi:hypothetical protein
MTTIKYICNKCGKTIAFLMLAGSPLKQLPCDRKECEGTYILQEGEHK